MTDASKRWSVGRPLVIGLVALVLLVGGFGGWALTAQITGAVIASGQIVVDQNRQVVQHPDGGVVDAILVKEGDTVSAGDILVQFDPEELRAELAIIEGQLFEILARRGRLEAERDESDMLRFDPILAEGGAKAEELMQGQQRLFEARRETVAQQVEQLGRQTEQIAAQIDGIRAQRRALVVQLDLIEQELENQSSLLERGLAQAGTVLNLQREKARLEGLSGELQATEAQAGSRITEIDIEILRLAAARREEAIARLRDLQFNELELRERRTTLLRQLDRLDVRAPVGGVVYGLRVFGPSAVVRPADPVLFIVPQDRPLLISARVAPTDIDQIRQGQEVTLRFSSLDQRRTPELFGTVQQVSADAFTDEASGISYYRAEIVMNEGEAGRLPPDVTLIPGMPVETFIRTAERTPITYLTRPLMDYFARTFREG